MKLSAVTVSLGLCVSTTALAGGLLLPGSGAVSTSRAGTGVASTEGGEALSLNPAGIAKSNGTVITIGAALISYSMSFHRNGTYDTHDEGAEPYEGMRYPVVENQASPPLGIGPFQPIPVIAITSDLGDRVPGLTVGGGLYAPNAYPFRDMNNANGVKYFVPKDGGGYDFPPLGALPPPTRYDIIEQEAAVILPSVAAAYSITPDLDVGGRFSLGWSEVKSTIAVWGGLANFPEFAHQDSLFTLDAKDSLVTAWSLGATYRPTPMIEVGAQYTAQISMIAEGDAYTTTGPAVSLGGTPIVLQPVADEFTRCNRGGTAEAFKGCVEFAIPMTATVGARYKFLDGNGLMKGDLELNVDWQNWSTQRASDYRVVVDAEVTTASMPNNAIALQDNTVRHGLRDTFGVRLGGSWTFPQGANAIIARGGLGWERGAAKPGWERADLDGAARTILTAGGSYRLSRVQIDAGFGYLHQGTRTDSRDCNPVIGSPQMGCGSGGAVQPLDERQGPDPINPLVAPISQAESPVNQGTYKSHYLLIMLGMSTWF
ncbi:MAG TPA: outer membrane protein transport protein [Kofleriaceae bacterium]